MIRPESSEFSQADARSDTPKGIRDPRSHKRERPRRGGGVARTRLLFSFLFFLFLRPSQSLLRRRSAGHAGPVSPLGAGPIPMNLNFWIRVPS